MNGTINIFKPIGMSSHHVVNILRKKTKIRRIGHAGTLDPNAAGVLVLCVGRATRISEYLLELDKEYIGELSLGIETDTQDMEGRVINSSHKKVSASEIEDAFTNYTGWVDQVPPMYSALKHKGKKLYELAREGKTVERKARRVFIESNEVLNITDNKQIIFRVNCSKGTYIRTLCNDIGRALNTYGYLSYLIRTRIGNFHISDSYSLDYIESLDLDDLEKILRPIDKSVGFMDSIYIDKQDFKKAVNGATVSLDRNLYRDYKDDNLYRIYCGNIFIGIGRKTSDQDRSYIKMSKVFV